MKSSALEIPSVVFAGRAYLEVENVFAKVVFRTHSARSGVTAWIALSGFFHPFSWPGIRLVVFQMSPIVFRGLS